jgi:signal transduction histidine kinase
MMMHARQSTNEKQLTDINKLLDDTTTLAFQGMRSTQIDFNCQIKRNLSNSIPKTTVIQQDISRVVLNLLNNAFYAVNERHKKQGASFEPVVTVTTAQKDSMISISIRDNGTGIPDDIKEKIFQPFFTTKPTGQGTGLGLSLSYEIIRAHGGDMQVLSKVGEYTEFIITLPIING